MISYLGNLFHSFLYNEMPSIAVVAERAEMTVSYHDNHFKKLMSYVCGIYKKDESGLVGMIHSGSCSGGMVEFCTNPDFTRIAGSSIKSYSIMKKTEEFDFFLLPIFPFPGKQKNIADYPVFHKAEITICEEKPVKKMKYVAGLCLDHMIVSRECYEKNSEFLIDFGSAEIIYVRDITDYILLE